MEPPRRIKVLFFLSALLTGGAERVTLNIIRVLDREKFEPLLCLARHEGALLADVPPDVKIYHLNQSRRRIAWARLAPLITRIRPDVVYSALDDTNITAIIAKCLTAIKGVQTGLVCSSHNTFSAERRSRWISVLFKLLIPKLYPLADRLVVISEGARQDYARSFPTLAHRFQTVYNPVFDDNLFHLAQEAVDHPWFTETGTIPIIVGCGRLVPQKGFRYLLEAVAHIAQHKPCRVMIIGDGPERVILENLAQQLHIEDRVAFVGLVSNPFKYIAQADLFVHTSLWDGLPTVLIEAMACGTPVIATDCPSGPREIVTDMVDGRLIHPLGNVQVLAEAIISLLDNLDLATHLAKQGKHRAETFHVKRIIKEYEHILEEVAQDVAKKSPWRTTISG